MANDDETLTFRLRAIAENMSAFGKAARGAENVNAAMIKSKATAEALANSNRKLTAARDREADAAGRVKVAEQRLNEVRANTKAKVGQIVAAEERLASARRSSSRATNDANRIEEDFKKVAEKALARSAEDAGKNAGHRFSLGFGKSLSARSIADDVEKKSSLVGRTFGSGILSGLEGLLRSEAGPAVAAALVAVLAVVSPAIGAVLAGGIVTAFGAGLVTLGIVFAAKSAEVKAKWKATAHAMGEDLRGISKPFEGVLIHMADSVRATFGRFAPILRSTFSASAGPVQKFTDDVLGALEKFRPALVPISRAFNALLASLGPALQDSLESIADGLTAVSNSVSRNPNGLPDFVRGVGDLTDELLQDIKALNDANGAFERLTGGTSAVTITMKALQIAVGIILGPILLLAKYITVVSSGLNALLHSTTASGDSMSDAANKTVLLAQGLQKTGSAANGAKGPLKSTHEIAVQNAAAAELAAEKYEHWVSAMFAATSAARTLAHNQLDVKSAILDATVSIKENGRTLNLNTAAGQANYGALLRVADAAAKQTEQLVRTKGGMVAAHNAAVVAHESFFRLARQMGLSVPQAKAMADSMIKIPNVTRTALLLANKKDLETKLAAAKRALADKDLTKERRAQLTATKKDLEKKLAEALRQLGDKNLTKPRIAQLQANKTNLDAKLKAARIALADPNLTKERRAVLNATISALQTQLRKAQAAIDALHGKVVEVKYTSVGVTTWSAAHTAKGVAATGKKIKGPGTGTSDTAGLFALSNNEWVIKAKSSQKYGDYAMGSVNAGTATIIPDGGMATGGPARINMRKQGVFPNLPAALAWTDKKFGGGNGLAFAKSQVGKPYIWGGVGPRGYDCSGFMSAIVNVLRGKNPYHRLFSTGTMPAGMFEKGAGRFNVGWRGGTRFKLGKFHGTVPGHMAGTLNGVNVESRGGRGVVVGPGARGASNGMFTSGVWHLKGFAKGGKVAGDPPFDGFQDWLAGMIPAYQQGTSYVPHDGMAYLHKGERVTSAADNQPGKLTLELKSDGSPYMQFLANELQKYIRATYGGDVQAALGGRRG